MKEETIFLTAKELAKILNITEHTIHVLSRQGKIPFYKLGKSYRYRLADFEGKLKKV